jgi:hypothetical protein
VVERPPIVADNLDVVERTSANAVRSPQVDAVSANLVGHLVNQRRVDGALDPIGQLDQHDVNAPVDQGRRHLQPEMVGADYQRPADRPGVEQAAQTDRVLQRAHAECPGWCRPWIDDRVGVPSAVTTTC